MPEISQTENVAAYVMTSESIAAYIQHEIDRGTSENSLRNFKRITESLYEWLSEDKTITKDRLACWRRALKDRGYTPQTELSYVKGINRYLDFAGCGDIRFNRGRAKNLTGKQFGYLTAIAPTGKQNRKDYIWRCRCQCGKEVEYPATRLLTGNVVSCGCLRGAHLKSVNKYIDGTSLRQSMQEQVHSLRAGSGYTGVTAKRGKWLAYIKYKGKLHLLGSYDKLEDAVKARARGKELVQSDTAALLELYEAVHRDDPSPPDREAVRQQHQQRKVPVLEPIHSALRSNNTSGCPGVFRKRDKWAARITNQKVTYQLGSYERMEDAIAVRQEAEKRLRDDPHGFSDWVQKHRQSGKQET